MALEQRRRKMVDYGGPLLPEELKQQSEIASENIRYKAKKIDDLGKAMTNGISIYDNYARRRAYEEAQKRQPPPGQKDFENNFNKYSETVPLAKRMSYRSGERGFLEDIKLHDFNEATGRQYTQEQFDAQKAYMLNTRVFKHNDDMAKEELRNHLERKGHILYDRTTKSIQFKDVDDSFKERTGKDLSQFFDKKKLREIRIALAAKQLVGGVMERMANGTIPELKDAYTAIDKMKGLPRTLVHKMKEAARKGQAIKLNNLEYHNDMAEERGRMAERRTRGTTLKHAAGTLGTSREGKDIKGIAVQGLVEHKTGKTIVEIVDEYNKGNPEFKSDVRDLTSSAIRQKIQTDINLTWLPASDHPENKNFFGERMAVSLPAYRADIAEIFNHALGKNETTKSLMNADPHSGQRRNAVRDFLNSRFPSTVRSAAYVPGKSVQFLEQAHKNYTILKKTNPDLTLQEYATSVIEALALENPEAREEALKGLWSIVERSKDQKETQGRISKTLDWVKGLFGGGKKEESK